MFGISVGDTVECVDHKHYNFIKKGNYYKVSAVYEDGLGLGGIHTMRQIYPFDCFDLSTSSIKYSPVPFKKGEKIFVQNGGGKWEECVFVTYVTESNTPFLCRPPEWEEDKINKSDLYSFARAKKTAGGEIYL